MTPTRTERDTFLVGAEDEANDYFREHDLSYETTVFIDDAKQLMNCDPTRTHIVLLHSYRQLRNFWRLQIELRLLERRGATWEAM
jgi:hypothetical protein